MVKALKLGLLGEQIVLSGILDRMGYGILSVGLRGQLF